MLLCEAAHLAGLPRPGDLAVGALLAHRVGDFLRRAGANEAVLRSAQRAPPPAVTCENFKCFACDQEFGSWKLGAARYVHATEQQPTIILLCFVW